MGYYHGKTYFAGLRKAGQLWFMAPPTRRASLEQLAPSGVARFTDLAEMVCRVRQVTPDRSPGAAHLAMVDSMELDTDPDDSEIVSDPEEYLEEGESGFISHMTDSELRHNNSLPAWGSRRAGSATGSTGSRSMASVVRRRHRSEDRGQVLSRADRGVNWTYFQMGVSTANSNS